ncbi:MAG: leucyl/phenylalanyl-tRNA--protein transferase [Wolinella sp.]
MSSSLFPHPSLADRDGLLCYGGNLDVETLLEAYSCGIFPWFSEGDPILWWSPNPRFVLFPKDLHFSPRTDKRISAMGFEVGIDGCFGEVIGQCAKIARKNQEGTWILPQVAEAYERLFEAGYAHSVEVFKKGELVGGLYGVSLGAAFFGESMFSRTDHASKAALKALCMMGEQRNWRMIDCQIYSSHLAHWGAKLISREEFLHLLEESLQEPTWRGKWS